MARQNRRRGLYAPVSPGAIRVLLRAAAIVSAVIPLLGQTTVGQKPAFEVASVKQAVFPSDGFFTGWVAAGGMCGPTRLTISGNRVTLRQVSLCGLVGTAYGLRDYLVSTGSNDWLKKEDPSLIYEIQATAPDSAGPLTPERARAMLQTLLAERFQLKFHKEIKEVPIYALVVGKNGPKFQLSENGPCSRSPNASFTFSGSMSPGGARKGGSLASCKEMTMQQFAEILSRNTDRPVVDQTGIDVGHVFELRWSGDGPEPSDAPSLFTALQEQMGLKLEATKAAVDVLVIDSVQKPTAN
jgi:uncharacterized protein (TIGR03435 family)